MTFTTRSLPVLSVGLLLVVGTPARADDGSNANTVHAELAGFDETPSVSSTGSGQFKARISHDGDAIEYELSYQDLEGSTVLFAHIHLGQRHTAGGVMAFLCGGGGKPACPPSPGRVRGRITADDVVGPGAQGIGAGELAEVVRALRAAATYANVHTDKHPSGEIRGQIRGDDD